MAGPRVKYSKTVDMYAFGIMCSELLTWTRAYHDVQVASVFSLRDKVVNQGLRPTIPPHIRNASPTTRVVGTLRRMWQRLCWAGCLHALSHGRRTRPFLNRTAKLCERCWSASEHERPTFADVTVELENVINNAHTAPSEDGDAEAKSGAALSRELSIGSGTGGGSRGQQIHADPNMIVEIDGLSALSDSQMSPPPPRR